MKKFYATTQKNVFATTVEASAVLSNEKFAQELLTAAMTEGKAFVVKGDEKVAADLQEMFMDRLNTMLDAAEEIGHTENLEQLLENGYLGKEVYEWLVDTLEARRNPVLAVEEPTAPVVIAKGVTMRSEDVLAAMAARGLVIGGACETPNGEGTVLGFEVGTAGTIAVIRREDGTHKLFVNALKGKAHIAPVAVAVETKQTKTNKEVSKMTNNNQSVNNVKVSLELAIDPAAKAAVEKAMEQEIPAYQLTAEERAAQAEMQLASDLAKFEAAHSTKEENASKLANSAQANALLGVLGAAGAAKTPAQAPAVSTPAGAPVAPAAPARSARQAAQNAGVNATQNKTNNNGGNVQMANQTQTRGAQGNGNRSAAGAFGGQQVNASNIRAAAGAGLELAGNFAAQSPALEGWANIKPMVEMVELDEYVGRGSNGNRDFVWYVQEAAKYEGQIMNVEELKAAGMKNEALGITDIKFYSPQAVASLRNRDARPEDFLVVEVFFGMTSYEFMFRKGTQRDGKPYIYSSNIARKQANSGNWYCEYVSSRRTDALKVVVQQDGVVRLARMVWENGQQVVHAEDAAYVQEVGGSTWVNAAPNYGIKIGQAPFIQLMMIVDEVSGLKAAREAAQQ